MKQATANVKSLIYVLVSSLLIVMLSSCATTQSLFEDDDLEEIEVLMLSTPSINPDDFDRPSPIRIDFFQLGDKSDFVYTDYNELIKEDVDLKDDVLEKTQYMLHPDEVRLETLELNEETKFMGVTAGYRNIDETQWKLTLLKQPLHWGMNKNYLYLKLDDNGILQLSKEEMQEELKQYAALHPESDTVTKTGKFKRRKLDYKKGVFAEE